MRQIIRLFLFGLFTYLVVTVAAFVYLEWWQAILASAATFMLLIFGVKLLIKTAIGRLGEMAFGMFAGAFKVKSQVLQHATADIHSVKLTDPPRELLAAAERSPIADDSQADDGPDPDTARRILQQNRWYIIEATIFPDRAAAGPMTYWDIYDLQLVPSDVVVSENNFTNLKPAEEFTPSERELYQDGEFGPVPDGGKLFGPQRVRLTVGIPKTVDEVKFRYYFETFGHIKLPNSPFLGPVGHINLD
jgi:hypothetical protein